MPLSKKNLGVVPFTSFTELLHPLYKVQMALLKKLPKPKKSKVSNIKLWLTVSNAI